MPWCKQISQPNPTKKLGADTIQNRIHHFRAILRWIDVDTERPLSKRSVNDLYDGICDRRDICVGRQNRSKSSPHLLCETGVRPRFVFSNSGLISGRPGVREMIGATGESTRIYF